jgi:hypothetical protein
MRKNSGICSASRFQASASTVSSSSRSASLISSPSRSSDSRVGKNPIGVRAASASPLSRWTIHFSTREFSPNPGHTNRPEASLRNQFT